MTLLHDLNCGVARRQNDIYLQNAIDLSIHENSKCVLPRLCVVAVYKVTCKQYKLFRNVSTEKAYTFVIGYCFPLSHECLLIC